MANEKKKPVKIVDCNQNDNGADASDHRKDG